MKTTRIFPVHGLASLILMSKHAQSRQFFEGVSFTRLVVEINYVCADFIGDSITKITSNKGQGPNRSRSLQKQTVSILIKYSCDSHNER